MNPDKLFDYLDGNLPADERARIEQQLANDAQLQRELAIAREIHKGMRESREVIMPVDAAAQERAGRIGRGVATAFIVLVLVNVLIGIAFIIGKNPRRKPAASDVQKQIAASAEKAAESALPAPTLADEIVLSASAADRDNVADKVVAAAVEAGGSAAKALPNEQRTTVIAEIPTNREPEFRAALMPLGAPAPSPGEITSTPGASANKLLQVQINAVGSPSAVPQPSP